MMCWNDARKTLYEMIGTLDEDTRTTWTKADEQFVINHYANGSYYGINTEIADQLGKTYTQVKSKVRQLQKKGLILSQIQLSNGSKQLVE
ncbi:hypothetical protein [Bacillus cihuensis]|uniref:hypothetical protein n=1 Tax=Bacillus cihuensis TaxID=1208599 RepID=UPI0004147E15|nr:hypothetical protein [Bacillus cihuensis]